MNEYKVKIYTYIDELSHRIDPVEIYGDSAEEEKNIVSEVFKKNGWEGDGEIKLIWIPPFMLNNGSTIGKYVWHVKQQNNGLSFLAFKGDFPFISDDWQPSRHEKKYFKDRIDGFKKTLDTYEESLDKISGTNNELLKIFLNGLHADIISTFYDFLNDFSLDIFMELVMYNNPYKLKINYRPNFNLSFKNVHEQEEAYPEGTYDESFVFCYSLIQALYDNFKFEPYEERIKVVCKAFDFDFFPTYGQKLRKQIEIRNAFQHRQGALDKKSYESIGMKVEIRQPGGGVIEYRPWNYIVLTIEEIKEFIKLLKCFCEDFMNSITAKIEAI